MQGRWHPRPDRARRQKASNTRQRIGISGWLADDADYEALALRVVALLQDEDLLLRAGRAARARAQARFALDHSIEATTRLLGKLTSQREPRRIGPLHEATRPIRANGAAVKAAVER